MMFNAIGIATQETIHSIAASTTNTAATTLFFFHILHSFPYFLCSNFLRKGFALYSLPFLEFVFLSSHVLFLLFISPIFFSLSFSHMYVFMHFSKKTRFLPLWRICGYFSLFSRKLRFFYYFRALLH